MAGFSGTRMKVAALVLVAAGTYWLLRHDAASEPTTFVGKWESSRSKTPTYIFANGEWEIRRGESKAIEYGVWRLERGNLIWTYKNHSGYQDDINPVLSANRDQFKLREMNGTVTTFVRIGDVP